GFDDVLVSRATAQVASDPEADFILGRRFVFLQQPVGAHNHAGRAETALQTVHLAKTFLQRVQRAVSLPDTFYGAKICTFRLPCEQGARFDRFAVKSEGAGAAV